MDGRKGTIQIKFRATAEEGALIEQKRKLVPTRNMEAYGNQRVYHLDRPCRQKSHDSKGTENRREHQSAAGQCDEQRLPIGYRGNQGGVGGGRY